MMGDWTPLGGAAVVTSVMSLEFCKDWSLVDTSRGGSLCGGGGGSSKASSSCMLDVVMADRVDWPVMVRGVTEERER